MEDWSEADVERLFGAVHGELHSLFGYDQGAAKALLAEWIDRFGWGPDDISHQGPFYTAVRIQYVLAEGGDASGAEYLEWRKRFDQIAEERRRPKVTPMQEAILRGRAPS